MRAGVAALRLGWAGDRKEWSRGEEREEAGGRAWTVWCVGGRKEKMTLFPTEENGLTVGLCCGKERMVLFTIEEEGLTMDWNG